MLSPNAPHLTNSEAGCEARKLGIDLDTELESPRSPLIAHDAQPTPERRKKIPKFPPDTNQASKIYASDKILHEFDYFTNLSLASEYGLEADLNGLDLVALECCSQGIASEIKNLLKLLEESSSENEDIRSFHDSSEQEEALDLDHHCRKTTALTCETRIALEERFSMLCSVRYSTFLRTGEIDSLLLGIDDAENEVRKSNQNTDSGHPLKRLVFLLLKVFTLTQSSDYLVTAISWAIQHLASLSPQHSDFSSAAADLGKLMDMKGDHTDEESDGTVAKWAKKVLLRAQITEGPALDLRVSGPRSLYDIQPAYFPHLANRPPFCMLCLRLTFRSLFEKWYRSQHSAWPSDWAKDPANRVAHARSLAALRLSAGFCTLCRVVLDALTSSSRYAGRIQEESFPLSFSLDISKGVEKMRREGFQTVYIWLRNTTESSIHISAGEESPYSIPGFCIPGTNIQIPGRLIASCIGPDHPAIFQKCQKWLDECLRTHLVCSRNEKCFDESKRPTRLLSLGGGGHINLVDGKSWHGPYSALSHCWGTEQPITTKRDSLNERQSGISFDTLPPTFRHAVIISRKLGVHYLWIDSLCIVQDDLLDWETESKKMGSIYQNALFTIAAAAAKNSQWGCFIPRAADKLSLLPNNFLPSGLFLFASPKYRHHYDSRLMEIDESPLQQRCWTLQEKHLSPRIIHWDEDQIFWECHECLRAESGLSRSHTKYFGKSLSLVQRALSGTYKFVYSPKPTTREKQFLVDKRDDEATATRKAIKLHAMTKALGSVSHEIFTGGGLETYIREIEELRGIKIQLFVSDQPHKDIEQDLSFWEVTDILSDVTNTLVKSIAQKHPPIRPPRIPIVVRGREISSGWHITGQRARELEEETKGAKEEEECVIVNLRRDGSIIQPEARESSVDLIVRESEDKDFWMYLWSTVSFTRYFFWYDLIRAYTLRKITYGSDKLPALAGIASVVHDVTHDDYLAGHWRTELIQSLFWIPLAASAGIPQPNRPLGCNRRAPSWSWASVDGHIIWDFPNLLGGWDSPVGFTILEARVQVKDGHNFGNVMDGSLKVRGDCFTARWDGSSWCVEATVKPTDKPWDFEKTNTDMRNFLKELRIVDEVGTIIGSWTHDHKLNAILPINREISSLSTAEVDNLTSWESRNFSESMVEVTKEYLGNMGPATFDPASDAETRRLLVLPSEIVCLRGATRMVSTEDIEDIEDIEDPRNYEHDILVLGLDPDRGGGFVRVGAGTIRQDYYNGLLTCEREIYIY